MSHPSENKFDFIVIGVGSMGSAACRYLAKRGYRVLGLEQFDVPHDLGAHSGQTRLIRKAYFEHPDYIPLLLRAYELWKELELESGERVYEETGIFYAGPRGHGLIDGIRSSASMYGIPLREIGDTHAQEFPEFFIPEGFDVLFEPEAGLLRPAKAIGLFAKLAERDGAVIKAREKVIEWKVADDSVEVATEKGFYRASKVVITTGPWTAQLLPGIAEKLKVTRQIVGWFDGDASDGFVIGKFPCWGIVDTDSEGLFYGFPWLDAQSEAEVAGMKVALHFPGEPTHPDHVVREVGDSESDALSACLGKFIPGAPRALASAKTCLYSNSPDSHFVIDNLPGLENYACVAWGFSGHGFKFASVVGEILADLAENGTTAHPISFLRAARFD